MNDFWGLYRYLVLQVVNGFNFVFAVPDSLILLHIEPPADTQSLVGVLIKLPPK